MTIEEEVRREEPVAGATPEKGEWEKEREKLKAELEAPLALREEERQTRKTVEDEKQIMEEGFRRNMDRMKEQKDTLLKEKDKLQRMEETEIEQIKEEL